MTEAVILTEGVAHPCGPIAVRAGFPVNNRESTSRMPCSGTPSCPGLSRASTSKASARTRRGWPGHRRAKRRRSSNRLCPAMTESVIGRPLGACFHLRRDGVRHVALTQTPGPWAPGAIPTVDFLLYRFRGGRQKNGCQESRSDSATERPRTGQNGLRCTENSLSHLPRTP